MAKLLWTLKQQVGPRPRVGHALAYDTQAARTLLFGGHFFQPDRLGDTWRWDGESWTQVDDIGPPARSDIAMAYDAQRNRTVLFGGTNGTALFNDTWVWNGEDWTQVADAGPAARSNHVMTFDLVRNCILLFGGLGLSGVDLSDTWQWDGNEWVQVEDTGPPARHAAAMTFDAARQRAVLFGGTSEVQVFGDTWEWDGASWTQASTFGPPPGVNATLVYTGARSLLFGGSSSQSATAVMFGNSWEWNGKYWTIRQDIGPGPRWGHAMAYDIARSRGVLFGGTSGPPGSATPSALGDTWEQFADGPSDGPPNPPPGPIAVDSIIPTPAQAPEGQGIALSVKLSGTPPVGTKFSLSVIDQTGTEVLSQDFDSAVPAMFLPKSTYTATAALGASSKSIQFQVIDSQGISLQSFGTNVSQPIQSGTPFILEATVTRLMNNDAITIPLMVTASGRTTVWLGQQLTIPLGQTSATVTIVAELQPDDYIWGATFGGSKQTVTIPVVE
jgi:hypothetical protein